MLSTVCVPRDAWKGECRFSRRFENLKRIVIKTATVRGCSKVMLCFSSVVGVMIDGDSVLLYILPEKRKGKGAKVSV